MTPAVAIAALLVALIVVVFAGIIWRSKTAHRRMAQRAQQAYDSARRVTRPLPSVHLATQIDSLPPDKADRHFSTLVQIGNNLRRISTNCQALDDKLLRQFNDMLQKSGKRPAGQLLVNGIRRLNLPMEELHRIAREYVRMQQEYWTTMAKRRELEEAVASDVEHFNPESIRTQWYDNTLRLGCAKKWIDGVQYSLDVPVEQKQAIAQLFAELETIKWTLEDNRHPAYTEGVRRLKGLTLEVDALYEATRLYATFAESYNDIREQGIREQIGQCLVKLATTDPDSQAQRTLRKAHIDLLFPQHVSYSEGRGILDGVVKEVIPIIREVTERQTVNV